jgi:8-amino-7-oxononanoate synthase
MHSIEQLPGRTARIDGEEWLYFSGTAYLGIVHNKAFQELVREGAGRYGTHYGGSRLASIQLGIFEEAEATLARWTGAPAALIVTSGMLAGQLVLRTFGSPQADYHFAPGLHPALWPESYRPFSGSFQTWTKQVIRRLSSAPRFANGDPSLLLANALDATFGRSHDFGWLRELKVTHPTLLIADDSHGLGITGSHGGGIYSQLQAPSGVEVLVVSSLAKAFGIPGGVILGSRERIQQIKKHPFFGGASPASPAFLHALRHGGDLYREARAQLRRNIRHFRRLVSDTELFQSIENHPVFYTPENELPGFLAARKVLVSNFPYPSPSDERITRVVLNTLHTAADVERLGVLIRAFEASRR